MVVIGFTGGFADRGQARSHGDAVDVHGARAANAGAATEFRAGQIELTPA